MVHYRITDVSLLTKEINKQLDIYQKIIDKELPAFNELIKSKGVNAVLLKPAS